MVTEGTVNLPGIEDTVINKAVPSGGDSALHFAGLKLAISPNVGNSDAKFLVVGDCVRASPFSTYYQKDKQFFLLHCSVVAVLSECFF